jgi:hypothetical protein
MRRGAYRLTVDYDFASASAHAQRREKGGRGDARGSGQTEQSALQDRVHGRL